MDDKKIEGFISDERCKRCNKFLIHYDRYDAFFCAFCNIWTEGKCSDPSCQFCRNRPERPL
ncbi:hypothetical protein D2962_14630 [Biomaibacter acetigenes]|uniref:Uncharacterized protein n=1 Tax=Biomaibacter acetigenes TaxID=2316383 RepID=A0A3G2RAA9_9FIRM|nr:hypothetical protein D2962_14630 [Biomaibacter acetigenes]RKL62640.1 hypothetical protein DXT63_10770 [Thermoanaerobacteraceae bacterium SP2]